MSAKGKLILMEFLGGIISIGLIILNVFLICVIVWYSIIGKRDIVYVLTVLFFLFSILIIPLGSLVMSAGLKWPDVSTLILFFVISFSPVMLLPGAIRVIIILCVPIYLTISFCTKRGKAYRQKLLDEIAAEEAAEPSQGSESQTEL